MANLNTGKDNKHKRVNVMYAPGVFTAPTGGNTITVTSQAQVEALIAKGWTRTAD